jgi:hypothetical protein
VMGSRELYCLGWSGTSILPILASCIAGMTGTCHCSQLLVELAGLALNYDSPDLSLPSS